MYSVHVAFTFALLQEICTKKTICCGIDEVKTKNVLPFGHHIHKRTHTRNFLLIKRSKKYKNITMPSLTCVWFVPAKGLIRGLSANSKNFIHQM